MRSEKKNKKNGESPAKGMQTPLQPFLQRGSIFHFLLT